MRRGADALFILRATLCHSHHQQPALPSRLPHSHSPTRTRANRRQAQKVGNGVEACCRPPLRPALPLGDALPSAVSCGCAGRQRPAKVAQRARHARRRRVRAAHHSPQAIPGHCRADHRAHHTGTCEGPGYPRADHHSRHAGAGEGPGYSRADHHSHHAGADEGPGHSRADQHSHHASTGEGPGRPRADNHSGRTSAGRQGPCHPRPRGRADHSGAVQGPCHPRPRGRADHSGAVQGPCHPRSRGRADHHPRRRRTGTGRQGTRHPCARCRADHRSRHSRPCYCPRRGSSYSGTQAQGQGPSGRTARQGNRACPGGTPSHRRGARGRFANSPPRRAFGRTGPVDQAHRRTRAGAIQEEALVQGQEEGEGARPCTGRRGPHQSQGRGAHHPRGRRGSRAQRRLHRRRHRERPGEEHRDDGGRDRGGARRGGDARLEDQRRAVAIGLD